MFALVPIGGKRRENGARGGYSLLEILIVLTIIALIATFVGPRLLSQLDRSKVTAARVQVQALQSALDTMHLDIGRYPTQSEGLALLTAPPEDGSSGWAGPYLNSAVPQDPWRQDYIYTPPSADEDRPRVTSLGSDGREGGSANAADISSVEQ